MRTTVVSAVDGHIEYRVSEAPRWEEPDGSGQSAQVHRWANGNVTLYRIPVGSSVPIHAGVNPFHCQVVTGRGKLVLPGDREIEYQAPEMFIFEPGGLHGWTDITEETLLSFCEVKA